MNYVDTIVVVVVLLFIVVSLYRNIVGPGFTFTIGVLVLGIFGILTPKEILFGFANPQIAIILLLLIIGDMIRKTSLVAILFDRMFRKSRSYKGFIWRMGVLVGGFSAFLNNTPLVAIMMPYLYRWGKKNNIAVSKLLIPLSYAAILGGCITLIGTSTNLIVNGFVQDQTIFPEFNTLGLFDFSVVGIPMLLIGMIYLIFFSEKLLPVRKDAMEEFTAKSREYMVEVIVRKSADIAGKSVSEAGLRNLKGLFLAEIIRESEVIRPVSPATLITEGDILLFAGDTQTIVEMIDSDSGLQLAQVGMFMKKPHTEVMEIVISHNSTLISKTVKQSNFRGKYDAAIIAIHRNGERITGKLGEVRLKAGDVLLLLVGDDFNKLSSETLDFYLISKIKDFRKLEWYKVAVLLGGTGLAILLHGLGILSLFLGLSMLLVISMILKIASPKDIHKSLDLNLAIIIAMSLALGIAMVKTGLAHTVSEYFIKALEPFGVIGLLAGIFVITNLLASYLTNKAAVALIFPISITMAFDLGLTDPTPFILIVAFAGAANFVTPIGYQTNLMVYGPGGYSFKDFMRIGFPLTVLYMIAAVTILYFVYLA
ncbi:MAG: SLC13 family permease, partial [Bacteroidales bacterium]|nr:SLC13 family permease [Bacteroidales bacterium]